MFYNPTIKCKLLFITFKLEENELL